MTWVQETLHHIIHDHSNTTASTWDSLASKWITYTHGVILTKCGYDRKGAATLKKRKDCFFRQWIEDTKQQNKVHAVPRGHQSSGYKDPEIRLKLIPKNTGD